MQAKAAPIVVPVIAEVGKDALWLAIAAALGIGISGAVSDPKVQSAIQQAINSKFIADADACTMTTDDRFHIVSVQETLMKDVFDGWQLLLQKVPIKDLPGGTEITGAITAASLGALFGVPEDKVVMANFNDNFGAPFTIVRAIPFQNMVTPIIVGSIAAGVYHWEITTSTNRVFIKTFEGTNYLKMDWYDKTVFSNQCYIATIANATAVQGLICAYGAAGQLFVSGGLGVVTDGIGKDVINVANDQFYADGVSVLNQTYDDVIGRIGTAVGLKNDAGDVISFPLNIPIDASKSIGKARDVSQEKVLGKDISTTADKEKDDTTNKDRDTTLPKPATLPDLALPEIIFKEKFPFCLPWDLYIAFSNLVAPAQPPKWEVPFKIQSLHFTQNVSVDFSQFSTLAAIMRWGLSLIFVIWLILLTRKIIGQ